MFNNTFLFAIAHHETEEQNDLFTLNLYVNALTVRSDLI